MKRENNWSTCLLRHNIQCLEKKRNIPDLDQLKGVVLDYPDHYLIVGNNQELEGSISFGFEYTKMIYAGLGALSVPSGTYELDLGLKLDDYFQNIKYFTTIKKNKLVKVFKDGNKTEYKYNLKELHIYPRIYTFANHLSRLLKNKQVICLAIGNKYFEGIAYDENLDYGQQSYIIFKNKFDTPECLKLTNSKDQCIFKNHDYYNDLKKKIKSLINKTSQTTPISIFLESEMSENDMDYIKKKIQEDFHSFISFSKDDFLDVYLSYDSLNVRDKKIKIINSVNESLFAF